MPYRYFTMSTGPTTPDQTYGSLTRYVAGVWNGSDGIVRIHEIRARVPTHGVCFTVDSAGMGGAPAQSPVGHLVVEKCTAYSGGTSLSAVKFDTSDGASDVVVSVRPDTTALVAGTLRRLRAPMVTNYAATSTAPWTVHSLVGAELGSIGGAGLTALDYFWSSADVVPITLAEDEGIAVRADQRGGYPSIAHYITVTVLIGTATYTFAATVAPNYAGEPMFVVFNTGATDAKIISIEVHAALAHNTITGQHQNNGLRVSTIVKPYTYTAVTAVQHDTTEAVPAGLLCMKDMRVGSTYAVEDTEQWMLEVRDITLGIAGAFILGQRAGQIGAGRVVLADAFNRIRGFHPHTSGQALWTRDMPALVVPVGSGIGIGSAAVQRASSFQAQNNLSGLASVVDIEIVLSYEAPTVGGSGTADMAFFG